MKVLVFMSSMYTGGAEFSTLTFYGWLRKQGYEIKLVCYKNATPSYVADNFGLETEIILEGKSFWQRLLAFRKIVDEFNPLLVHSVLFEANILGRFYRRLYGKNCVHLESLVNEMYSPQRLKDPHVTWWKLKAYQLFDRVTQWAGVDHFHANGRSVANHYMQKLGIAPSRVTVIPRGRAENPYLNNPAGRVQMRSSLGIGDEVLFVTVGRHEFQKGHDTLVKAVHWLNSRQKNFQVVVAGREGRLTQQLNEAVRVQQLGNVIRLIGHRNDIPAFLAAGDVFVFPSRYEGLPGVLIEAEAAALPIICTDIANNHEVAVSGRNALFFNTDDAEGLARLMLRLSGDAGLRQNMGMESLKLFRERFSIDLVHRGMKELVDKLIALS